MSNLFLCNPLAKKPVIILVLSGRCLFLKVVSRALRRAIARESLGNGAVPLRLIMGGAFAFLMFSNHMLVYESVRRPANRRLVVNCTGRHTAVHSAICGGRGFFFAQRDWPDNRRGSAIPVIQEQGHQRYSLTTQDL